MVQEVIKKQILVIDDDEEMNYLYRKSAPSNVQLTFVDTISSKASNLLLDRRRCFDLVIVSADYQQKNFNIPFLIAPDSTININDFRKIIENHLKTIAIDKKMC